MKLFNISLLYFLFYTIHNVQCLLETRIIEGNLDEKITVEVNKSLEFIIDYSGNLQMMTHPLRVCVESTDSNISAPAIVVVRQKKEVLSWELPLIVDAYSDYQHYNYSARTLCYDGSENQANFSMLYTAAMGDQLIEFVNVPPIVTISTMSETNISANVILTTENDFYLKPSVNYTVTISPSTPRFYYYGFPKNKMDDLTNYETVILEIFSANSVCMTVSLQNFSCPVRDLNDDITFQGVWETISEKGGLTISKNKFPYGFFLVFVAKGNNFDCIGTRTITNNNRTKEITFMIKPSITYNDYFNAVIITVGTIVLFYIFFGISLCYCNTKYYTPRRMEFVDNADSISQGQSTVNADSQSLNSYDTLDESESQREIVLTRSLVYVSDLSRRNQLFLVKKSYSYLWHVMTVALFYFLPVIQLVITYQKVVNDTGNQDLCYYNFLCAHPFGFFSDFNHIFSNIGYICFGFLFIFITYRREQTHEDMYFDRNYGVPHHYGLFYAMGFALVMEGVLSGSYHICPNHSNFQFDTSFMYVTAVLCMIKLYHTRHPDINASAYSTFGVLAIAILLGMIGILEPNILFWIFFTVLHLVLCFYLTFKVYYLGNCKFDRAIFLRAYRIISQDFSAGALDIIKPKYKSRMVLLVIGNLLNWVLAAVGIYSHGDFAIYLLGLFMLNTVYYFTFYIIMKLLHKETINCLSLSFLIISLTCAGISMYCFFHKSISWSKTPAQSRHYNQECLLMRFYDFHDMWHFLSSVGMFFMFMVLLTLDDDLSHKPRSEIVAF